MKFKEIRKESGLRRNVFCEMLGISVSLLKAYDAERFNVPDALRKKAMKIHKDSTSIIKRYKNELPKD